MHQVVIGTAGHIDHGKTALVEALTGTNTDTLAQEKERGITIDIGFAYLNDNITIVDVPGHQKFIRNMVAGASTIHIGLLIIAADDGIMPQTIEHLQILNSLSIKAAITVITKIDLADDDWLDLVISDVKKLEENTIFQGSPIFKVDSRSNKGIDELRKAIISLSANIKFENESEFFKMHIDRVFSKKGYGPVVTGTVKNGRLSIGQSVEILPENIKAKVRGIQTHGGDVSEVRNGYRAAINLTKVDMRKLKRGSTLANPGLIVVSDKLLARITMSAYTNWALKNNQRVRIHIGTDEILARVKLYQNKIKKDESCNLIIFLEKSVGATIGDLIIIRSYSPLDTIASGIILETDFEIEKQYVENYPLDINERLKISITKNSNKPNTVDYWSKKYFISKEYLEEKLKLIDAIVSPKDDLVYLETNLEYWKKETLLFLRKKSKDDAFHSYVELSNLMQSLQFSEKWASYIIEALIKSNDVILKSGRIFLAKQSSKISKEIKKDLSKINYIIDNIDFNIISIKELILISKLNPRRTKELVFLLIDNKSLLRINDDIIMGVGSFNKLLSTIRKYFTDNKIMSISDFKILSNLTRKNAIPILEYFDDNHFTIRNGSNRIAGETLYVE